MGDDYTKVRPPEERHETCRNRDNDSDKWSFCVCPPDDAKIPAPHTGWIELGEAKRIAICGGPRVGKTTLAYDNVFARHAKISTDDLINKVDWDSVPEEIARLTVGVERFVVEGVQAGRCLRRGLAVDLVIWLERPHVELSEGQRRMWKACRNIFSDWLGMPESNGVKVLRL